MSVSIKSKREIEIMREAGRILGTVMRDLSKEIKPGMSTYTVDKLGEEMIRSYGCIPSCKGYEGYPAAFCISVNEAVVHSIPSKKIILKEGDIVSLDVGVEYEGGIGDTARTVYVGDGPVPSKVQTLLDVTREALEAGIKAALPGNYIRDISAAIEKVAKRNGIGVVRDFVGHGCGTKLHEPPEVPNYVTPRRGPLLQPGMVLAIEPMFNLGTYKVFVRPNRWTVCTCDGEYSAHFEHMVLITNEQPEVLTRA